MGEVTVTDVTEPSPAGARTHVGAATATRVYTPDSPLREPRSFLAAILRDMRAARILAWRLVVRDIAAQYRQTVFGYLWAALPAVVNALVWVALDSSGVISVNTGAVPYVAYVLTGTIFWQLFLDALNAPLKQLNQNRSMLNRVNFPTEALLASGVAQVLFSFLVKLVVLAVVLAAFGAPVKWTAPAVLLPAFGLLTVGTVLGVLIAPIGMLYKDVEQSLTVIVMPLMFLTPVIYPAQSLGTLGTITRLNPLTPMFEVLREFLFGGVGPYVAEMAIICAATLVLAAFGWVVYRLSLPIMIERLEA
jgi:homopolymeric O-antigen transport system permease protein